VTRRVLAELAVVESETRFRLLAENSADIVVHLRDGICEWASPSIATPLGWDPSDAVGLPGVAWVHPDDLVSVIEALAAVDAVGSNRARFRMMAKDGSFHWLDGHATPFVDAAGNVDGIVVSARVVDAEVRAQEALELRARQDLLTGLANRAELFDHFSGRMSRSPRSGHLIAVVFADLDDFKGINDAFGHAAGDAYLRAVADRMVAGVRRGDFVARIGGDELLVVLDGVHDADEAVAIADKLRAAVADPVEALGVTMRGTVSMGVTLADPGEAMDEVVARADRAMYAAKAGGRDRVIRLCTVDDH
jgi:diguanylate cyclase (GGDEF)-like protein/PAS domain S-box-containing protein